MKIQLTVSGGPDDGYQFLVTAPSLVIGRGMDVDWPIHDRWLSRRHCELLVSDHEVMIRDLGSKHGTWVNHVPVRELALQHGDHITIGTTALHVEIVSEQGEPVKHELMFGNEISSESIA